MKPVSSSDWGFEGMNTVRSIEMYVLWSVNATSLSRSLFVKRPVSSRQTWTLSPSFKYSILSQYSQAWDWINIWDIRNPPNSSWALNKPFCCFPMEAASLLARLLLTILARMSTNSNWKSKMFSLKALNSAIVPSKFSHNKKPLAIAFPAAANIPPTSFNRSQAESFSAPHMAMFCSMRCRSTLGV